MNVENQSRGEEMTKHKKKHKAKHTPDVHEAAAEEAAAEAMAAVEAEALAEEESAEETAGDEAVDAAEATAAQGDETELETAIRERGEYLEMAQKARAELENFRRRVARDRDQDKIRTQAGVLRELLTPLDDLERALKNGEEERNFDTLFEGLQLVRGALWKALETTGFQAINAGVGVAFNPNVHEAVLQIPHPEVEANGIVEEVSPGYQLEDFVIRASKVVVSAGAPAVEGAAE